jgi:prevent-host-death family protein
MISDQIISITDLRQNATHIIEDLKNNEKIVVVHNSPKAAIIDINDYDEYKKMLTYKDFLENVLFLLNNPSLDFLKNEPDLYE